MAKKVTPIGRRKSVHGISLASAGDVVASTAVAGLERPVSTWAGAILHASEGQRLSTLTPNPSP